MQLFRKKKYDKEQDVKYTPAEVTTEILFGLNNKVINEIIYFLLFLLSILLQNIYLCKPVGCFNTFRYF